VVVRQEGASVRRNSIRDVRPREGAFTFTFDSLARGWSGEVVSPAFNAAPSEKAELQLDGGIAKW
jgi:hypothetical protein